MNHNKKIVANTHHMLLTSSVNILSRNFVSQLGWTVNGMMTKSPGGSVKKITASRMGAWITTSKGWWVWTKCVLILETLGGTWNTMLFFNFKGEDRYIFFNTVIKHLKYKYQHVIDQYTNISRTGYRIFNIS